MKFQNIFKASIMTSLIGSIASQQLLTKCKPGYVALAYDDGPFIYTSKLIDILNSYNVKATFFVNAHNFWWPESEVSAEETIIKAYSTGHQIGSHTFSHSNLELLLEQSENDFISEVSELENFVHELIGKKPAFLRFPYGAYNDNVINYLNNLGYTSVTWSADSKDYEYHDIPTEMARIKEAYNSTKIDEGFIILAHDVFEDTAYELTENIIKYTLEEGFQFATVAECINQDPYQP